MKCSSNRIKITVSVTIVMTNVKCNVMEKENRNTSYSNTAE